MGVRFRNDFGVLIAPFEYEFEYEFEDERRRRT
jgi:hypothetical protein